MKKSINGTCASFRTVCTNVVHQGIMHDLEGGIAPYEALFFE